LKFSLSVSEVNAKNSGLELVNNNASDIADGNPRIVLGLIWQIILHFQKMKCDFAKSAKRFIGWKPADSFDFFIPAARKLNMRVENMDRDWKDGVMFNALVHRWKPDVVDMEKMYFRVRREFIEYRSLYNTIMATKLNYTIEELSLIQERWEIIRNNLEATAVNAEKRLPKPYSSLSVWTATGQSIINTPLNLPTENPQKCLVILQKMISEHNRHFIDMAAKMEELNTAADSGGLGGRPVAAEYVEPLRIRMTTLADEAPLKLATLKILYAHYTLLAYLQEIESKMRLWSSAESLQLLNRWLTEYSQLEKENPRSKCSHYIEDLRKTLASEPNTKLDGDSMMYFRVRREFIEYRSLYNTIMATKLNYTIEELSLIQERWEIIRNNLEATAVNAEKRLPKPYSSLSVWTATGQSIINTPLNLPTENPQKCLVILQKMISEHNRHFIDMAAKMEELNTAADSGGLGGRPVAAEYVEPLRIRMTTLADEAPLKLATLKILYAHYTLLAYLQEIDSKMRLWSSAESLQLLNRWLTEYSQLEKENPRSKCSHYIEDLRKMLASEPNTKLDGDSMEYVREVMTRAELILDRKESTDDEIRASLNDMADCEVVLRDWNSKRLTALRERWEAKRREFELWQTQMDRVQQIAATLERSQGLDPSIIVELQRIEESCDQMLMTDLAHSLRLAVRRLRVLLETSYEERLESLKMSGEEDCTVAHNIVQEVGEELVAFCPQLNERHIEARQVLSRKMELFRRLQNYYDAVKYLRNQNISWNTITVAQVPSVSTELRTLLERCDTEWQNDASQLRQELNGISGSFFELEFDRVPSVSTELRTLLERCDTEWQNDASQLREELNGISGSFFELEFDRVNEKLNLLTYEKDKLRDLMRIRLEYLDAVRDFIASADSSIDINQMATPSDSPHVLQDRMKQLCSDLEEKAKHLKQLQDPAEMIISDLTIPQLIKKFRWQLMGPEDDNTFSDSAHRFENLISRPMPSSDDPQQFLTITLELMRSEESESKAFDEMNELAISESDRSERDRLAASFKNRQEQRNV
ncbi:hypothetical protein TELCIR_10148, partial [Teladorsagia circumcincta]